MKQLLFFFLLFIYQIALAQNIETTILDLNVVQAEKTTTIPFAAITVIDARFDQSNIGSIHHIKRANASRVKSSQTKASFPDSLHLYLPKIFEKFVVFDKESRNTLVLLVKQFRLTDRVVNKMSRQFEPEIFLRLSFSAYCKKGDKLNRLFAMDDLISKKLPTDKILSDEVKTEYYQDAVIEILQKVLSQRSWQETGPGFSMVDVQQGVQKRFQLPLFTDSTLHAGIYKTFQEFRQNAPSLKNPVFKIKNNALQEVTDSAGRELDLKEYWGVCDGKKKYIIFRQTLHELSRSDKTFYFNSYIKQSELAGRPGYGDYATQNGLLGAALMKSSENKRFPHVFYLNMDEGAVCLEEIFGKSTLKQMEKDLLK